MRGNIEIGVKPGIVFTSIYRAVYVELSVPRKQSYMPLPTLGAAISTKLPPTCAVPEEGKPSRRTTSSARIVSERAHKAARGC